MADETDNKPLLKLNIVITRPAHQSQALSEKIKALGGNPISIPCMSIEPLEVPTTLQQIPSNTDYIIFVSANAVNHSLKLINSFAQHNRPTIIAIGPGTQAALQQAGLVTDFVPHTFNSEGLLALPALQEVQNKNILLCCGKDSRPFLLQSLQKRGANVTPIICYQRIALSLTDQQARLLKQTPIDCVITTSQSGLLFWQKMVKDANLEQILAAPTLIVAKKYQPFATQIGFTHLLISDSADDSTIVNTIIHNLSSRKAIN